jgi:nucleoside-diphosphate-sugar epimerase
VNNVQHNHGDQIDHTSGRSILVTGGSGFVGRYLVKQLSKKDRTVISLYRHKLPEPMSQVYPVCSDMSSPDLLLAPLRGIHTVIHLAWEGSFINQGLNSSSSMETSQLTSNAKMTKNLLQAIKKSNVKRLIFVSVIGASAEADSSFLREKYLTELLVLNSKVEEKIILRAPIAMGEGGASDRIVQTILNLMRMPAVYPVPFSKQTINPVHVEDIVKVISKFVEIKMTKKAVVCELTGSSSYRIDEFFQLIGQKYQNGQKKIPIKGFMGNQLYHLMERDHKRLNRPPKLKELLLSNATQIQDSLQINNELNSLCVIKSDSVKAALV